MRQPTPYPASNTVLQELPTGAPAALGENFVGLYRCGSLAALGESR